MKNKYISFIIAFTIVSVLFVYNVKCADNVLGRFKGNYAILHNSTFSYDSASVDRDVVSFRGIDSSAVIRLCYCPEGVRSNNGITYYYFFGGETTSNKYAPMYVSASSGYYWFFENMPSSNYPVIVVSKNSNTSYDYVEDYVEAKPFLVKVFDVIVSASDYISNSKLGQWIDGLFHPIGSIVSVDMGDTVTVTSVDNSVTYVPTTYLQPNISYNGFNASVNINTNKVVDYMGKSEDTFKSITYNITYEYIDDNSESNTVTYTYNYNYDDKVITYGPDSDPDENNSTDDTTITVVQPDGSNDVQNSGGALSTLISTIANIFISAVSGLIGGLASVVSSLSSLVTSTGGLFNTLGEVISPLYQGTIIGDIVTLLGLSLIATFIIGFFKR